MSDHLTDIRLNLDEVTDLVRDLLDIPDGDPAPAIERVAGRIGAMTVQHVADMLLASLVSLVTRAPFIGDLVTRAETAEAERDALARQVAASAGAHMNWCHAARWWRSAGPACSTATPPETRSRRNSPPAPAPGVLPFTQRAARQA